MGVAVADAGGLSQDASRVRQYLRLVAPLSLVACVVLVLVARRYPIPLIQLLAVLVLLNTGLQGIAYRLAGAGRVDASLFAQATGLWLLALGLSLSGVELFAVVAALSLMPVVISMPYVSVALLLRMTLIGTAIVAFASIFVVFGAPLPLDVPAETLLPIVCLGVPATVVTVGLSLWHTRYTLDQASEEIEHTNRALRASEESLEDKVEERSRELERSQREIARARDDALAANRHKSAFLANMSHELRTPLNAIIGFSEVLGEGVFGALEGKQSEYVGDIHQSGHHLLAMINDILDLSKIEADRLELDPASFDLTLTCQHALTAMHDRAARRGVELREELGSAPLHITADERRVRQVLANLLSNAVKYTDAGGSVTLGLRAGDGAVEVAVADTGIGIAPRDQAVIFEAFQQTSDSDYTRAQAGAGVGLALTRRLVELHGGTIAVQSEPGRGSTFRVQLPLEPRGGGS